MTLPDQCVRGLGLGARSWRVVVAIDPAGTVLYVAVAGGGVFRFDVR